MLDFFLDAQEYNKSETETNSGKSEVERVFSAIRANLNNQLVSKVRFGVLFFKFKHHLTISYLNSYTLIYSIQ